MGADEAAIREGIIDNLTNQWKAAYSQQIFQRYMGQWLVYGAMAGGLAVLGGLYYYLDKNPSVRSTPTTHVYSPARSHILSVGMIQLNSCALDEPAPTQANVSPTPISKINPLTS
jgi:hypothetical protein